MKTQAWGWLAAAVLAAGLNASYYDGGFQWAHRVADRLDNSFAAMEGLASGRAGQFLAEARVLTSRPEASSCPLATTLARVQTRIAQSEYGFDRFEAMSAREEARVARMEAARVRIEARVAAVQAAHFRVASAQFAPIALKAVCPRVRVNILKLPAMKMPVVAPEVHVELSSNGPV